jgi:hypothetical protein
MSAWTVGIAGLLGAAALGVLVQTFAARRDAQRYPPPGRMVDVGG